MSAVGRLVRLWPYALVAFLYLATSPYHRGLNNPNEMARVYMSRALAEDGTFIIDGVIRTWGMVDDKAVRDGKLYSSKAPFQSLIGVPAYEVAEPLLGAVDANVEKRTITIVLRIFGSVVFGIAFAWILLAWCRRRAVELDAPRTGTAIGIALALGTMLYPYSLTFTGHVIAAFAAGGTYLALLWITRLEVGSKRWRYAAILMGLAGGTAPFAEYPSALVAAPALVAAFVIPPTWKRRAELFGWLAVGGAIPFGIGLWAHDAMWGSPFKTGYSFLENKGYVKVHGDGFFGVTYPKMDALGGSLFSPGTGLFFFSPVLFVGLAFALYRCVVAEERRTRTVAISAVVGFVFSLLFLSGHEGWRGGWTVGPRYIIAVAPVLGLWAVEALAIPRLRTVTLALGALSIVLTGFAAALYPHLSDVYVNPLATFLWPSYLRGESTYGIAHTLGLRDGAANLVHIIPLVVAIVYVTYAAVGRRAVSGAVVLFVFTVGLGIVAFIPERDELAARKENNRLWGFWEPSESGDTPRRARPGLIWTGRSSWRDFTVTRVGADGQVTPCRKQAGSCSFGTNPWQKFGPDRLEFDGAYRPILFMHPVAKEHVRATFPVLSESKTVVIGYGLADAAVTANNPSPIEMRVVQGDQTLETVSVENEFGMREIEIDLTSTASITIDLIVENDGARVFGMDIRQYRAANDP